MHTQVFQRFEGDQVTDDMLQEAAKLFSENYGVWGTNPGSATTPTPGSRVRMSKKRLQNQSLPDNVNSSYARVTIDGQLVANAFASRWDYDGRTVCWITQLVVHKDFRERGLAVGLLNLFKGHAIYGIMSSHPAACMATAKAFRSGIYSQPLSFIGDHAAAIMAKSPITYVREARPRGKLFHPEDTGGAVSSVDTEFFVDHHEPLEALAAVRDFENWPLGELFDGHEFLLLIEARPRKSSP